MPLKVKAITDEFEVVGEGAVDDRKRLSLAKALSALSERLRELGASAESVQFRVSINDAGQILLDPALAIPLRELWLYKNPVALSKVREGLADSKQGKTRDLGSFARYADDEIE